MLVLLARYACATTAALLLFRRNPTRATEEKETLEKILTGSGVTVCAPMAAYECLRTDAAR